MVPDWHSSLRDSATLALVPLSAEQTGGARAMPTWHSPFLWRSGWCHNRHHPDLHGAGRRCQMGTRTSASLGRWLRILLLHILVGPVRAGCRGHAGRSCLLVVDAPLLSRRPSPLDAPPCLPFLLPCGAAGSVTGSWGSWLGLAAGIGPHGCVAEGALATIGAAVPSGPTHTAVPCWHSPLPVRQSAAARSSPALPECSCRPNPPRWTPACAMGCRLGPMHPKVSAEAVPLLPSAEVAVLHWHSPPQRLGQIERPRARSSRRSGRAEAAFCGPSSRAAASLWLFAFPRDPARTEWQPNAAAASGSETALPYPSEGCWGSLGQARRRPPRGSGPKVTGGPARVGVSAVTVAHGG